MANGLSSTDICNQALDLVKEAPIGDMLSDTTPKARWFQRNYATTRDALLAEHPWNFAVKYASLPVNAAAPVSRWLYGYQIPSDCLRLLPLQKDGYFEGALIAHEVNGQTIETDATAPLRVRYIRRVDAEGEFSPLFVKAFAAQLAMNIAHWITGKASALQIAQQVYETTMAKAKRIDGMEGTFERPYDDDVIAARFSGGYTTDGGYY